LSFGVVGDKKAIKAGMLDCQLIALSVPKNLISGTLDYQSFMEGSKLKIPDNQRVSQNSGCS